MSKRKAIDAIGIGPGTGPDGVGARFYVFGLGIDNQMYYKYRDGNGVWHPSQTGWEPLGGTFVSPPSVALRDLTSFDIVGLGIDNNAYHKYWDGNAWHPSQTGWEPLGGVFVSPLAISGLDSVHDIDIVGVGPDNQMYHKYWDGNAWQPSQTGWEALGGTFVSPPAVAGLNQTMFNVMALGTDNQMYYKYSDGNAWYPSQTGWEPLGGIFINVAACGMSSDVQFDIFGLGAGPQAIRDPFRQMIANEMYHKSYGFEDGWSPSQIEWESLGGVFVSEPSAVEALDPLNRVDVFALGTDNQMYHKSKYYWGGWDADWQGLGGTFTSAPACGAVGFPTSNVSTVSEVHVVALGTDNQMYHKYFDGATWHPSLSGWEGLGGTFTIP